MLRHDVRNRVNVVRGNADLIAKGTDAAETIRTQVDEMRHLGEQARELEAVLSEETVETEPVDLAVTLEAEAMAARAAHSCATVHVDVREAATAEVSPRIDSAVDVLLENAIVHNDAAEPTVRAEAAVVGRGPAAVEGRSFVRVVDDGPGIREDEVAGLERSHETALEHTSGLGLWLVDWIVTRSGGAVDFESRAGGEASSNSHFRGRTPRVGWSRAPPDRRRAPRRMPGGPRSPTDAQTTRPSTTTASRMAPR